MNIYLRLRPSLRRPFRALCKSGPWSQSLRPGLSCWTPSGSLVLPQKPA